MHHLLEHPSGLNGMAKPLKLAILLPVLGLMMMASPSQADDNGNGSGSGSGSTARHDFCDGLGQSCSAACDALNDGTLKGAVARRQCGGRCADAAVTCEFGMKNGQTPGLKKPIPKGVTPQPKTQQ